MAHVVFIDSSATGLLALRTAKRMGHRVSLVLPRRLSMIQLMKAPKERLEQSFRDVDDLIEIEDMFDGLVDAVQALHARVPVDAVLTTSDLAVMPTADAAAAIGARYTAQDRLRRAVLKDECRSVLREAGLRSPRFATALDLAEAREASTAVGFPLVVKPARGLAKAASAIARDWPQLEQFFHAVEARRGAAVADPMQQFLGERFVLESYIEGGLFSAEVAVVDGEAALMVTTRRERATHNPLFEVAAAMPSGLEAEEEKAVLAYVRALFSALGLSVGIYHVEFIMSDEGPVLVEINARMMGGIAPQLYQLLSGIDPFETLIDLHLGRPVRVDTGDVRGAGVVIAVGAPDGGVVPADAERAVGRILGGYAVHQNTLRLEAGYRLPPFSGNFSILGFLGLTAASTSLALSHAAMLLDELEAALGFRLAKFAAGSGGASAVPPL